MRILAAAFVFLSTLAAGQAVMENENPNVPLTVVSGAPLRLYLTKRVSKRLRAPVGGKTYLNPSTKVRPGGVACRIGRHGKSECGSACQQMAAIPRHCERRFHAAS